MWITISFNSILLCKLGYLKQRLSWPHEQFPMSNGMMIHWKIHIIQWMWIIYVNNKPNYDSTLIIIDNYLLHK